MYTLSFIVTKQLVHFLTFKTEHFFSSETKKKVGKKTKARNKITVEKIPNKILQGRVGSADSPSSGRAEL